MSLFKKKHKVSGRASLPEGCVAVTRENFWEARGHACAFLGGDEWFDDDSRGGGHPCTLLGFRSGGIVCDAAGRRFIIPYGRVYFNPGSSPYSDM